MGEEEEEVEEKEEEEEEVFGQLWKIPLETPLLLPPPTDRLTRFPPPLDAEGWEISRLSSKEIVRSHLFYIGPSHAAMGACLPGYID